MNTFHHEGSTLVVLLLNHIVGGIKGLCCPSLGLIEGDSLFIGVFNDLNDRLSLLR